MTQLSKIIVIEYEWLNVNGQIFKNVCTEEHYVFNYVYSVRDVPS